MLDRITNIISSLRLTVVLLALGIVLVFIGTIAQADEGLYQAQQRYFKHWVIWGFSFFGHKVPLPYPGGYLIGSILLLNLLASHILRFKWGFKKFGIHLTHAGVILLLVGQLTTDMLSRETQMRFSEGESRSYSESPLRYELAFVSDVDANTEDVVAIPERDLARGGEVKHEKLPFTVHVKSFWPNSETSFRAPMMQNEPPLTDKGIARNFDFKQVPETRKMEDKNVPTTVVELISGKGSLGTWVASGWAGDEVMVSALHRSFAQQAGPQMGNQIAHRLTEPQIVDVNGKKYTFTLRPARVYNPFSLTLLKTTHTIYPGTDIPKDFRSRVLIDNPNTGEKREVEVYMNSPLRYGGQTFYQYQMGRDEMDSSRGNSALQVVRNPSWLAPYFGCLIVGLGLVVQFMIHLVGFISTRRNQ
jgi:ResB-like family